MRAHTHTNPYSFYEKLDGITLQTLLPTCQSTLDLEIGSGTGLFLRHYAAANPNRHILGVEVRKKLADLVNTRLAADGLSNAALVWASAERLLTDVIADSSIDNVFVFHPDPWFKKRHHNRRVVRPEFLNLLRPKLSPSASLYLSTDVTILWEEMTTTLRDCGWTEVSDPGFWKAHYRTHWQRFTVTDDRPQHIGVFVPPVAP